MYSVVQKAAAERDQMRTQRRFLAVVHQPIGVTQAAGGWRLLVREMAFMPFRSRELTARGALLPATVGHLRAPTSGLWLPHEVSVTLRWPHPLRIAVICDSCRSVRSVRDEPPMGTEVALDRQCVEFRKSSWALKEAPNPKNKRQVGFLMSGQSRDAEIQNFASQLALRLHHPNGKGSGMVFAIRHWSNAGISSPSRGQDFFTVTIVGLGQHAGLSPEVFVESLVGGHAKDPDFIPTLVPRHRDWQYQSTSTSPEVIGVANP
jgi:Lipid A 3-O-deacylase (PagL)